MGRYYNGDIDGKFWFGLQSSDSADRFGVSGVQPEVLNYYYSTDELDDVKEEIANIEERLGNKLKVIVDFLKTNDTYNDEVLAEIGINQHELMEYADLLLGIQIRDCIIENGECNFEAEC